MLLVRCTQSLVSPRVRYTQSRGIMHGSGATPSQQAKAGAPVIGVAPKRGAPVAAVSPPWRSVRQRVPVPPPGPPPRGSAGAVALEVNAGDAAESDELMAAVARQAEIVALGAAMGLLDGGTADEGPAASIAAPIAIAPTAAAELSQSTSSQQSQPCGAEVADLVVSIRPFEVTPNDHHNQSVRVAAEIEGRYCYSGSNCNRNVYTRDLSMSPHGAEAMLIYYSAGGGNPQNEGWQHLITPIYMYKYCALRKRKYSNSQ